jgi:hypothetical protein
MPSLAPALLLQREEGKMERSCGDSRIVRSHLPDVP